MKLDKRHKLHRATAKDNVRTAPVYYLELRGKPSLVATTGRALAVVPVEPAAGDTYGTIPVEALKEACKGSQRTEASISCNGSIEVQSGKGATVTYERGENYGELTAEAIEAVLPDPFAPEGTVVYLNAKYLVDLASALGSDVLRLEVRNPEEGSRPGPIEVRPAGSEAAGNEASGLLMPCVID